MSSLGLAIMIAALLGLSLGGPRPARADEAETHLLQVEEFEGPWRTQTNLPGYLGAGFKTSNADGVATTVMRTTVVIAGPGRFAVWARGYEGEGWDRSFSLSIGGHRLPPTHTSRKAHGFCWQKAGEVECATGPVEVVVHDHGDSFEVADAVCLTTDLGYDPAREEQAKRVLPNGEAESQRLIEALVRQTVESADAGHARWLSEMHDRQRWEVARRKLQARFRATVGLDPLPKRTALNVQSLGETAKAGYTIQRLTFESRPGFIVTANLYRPVDSASFPPAQNIADLIKSAMLPAEVGRGAEERVRRPAVLCPCGHWQHAKAQEQVQARCAGLAKLGFIALTYDPFGQGERSVDGNGHHEYFRTVLAGRNNMSYMLWDTMRALDYLLTRDDVDPDRIACTGASGGGLNTLYAAAVDERIKVAVPVVYATSFREFLGTQHDHCPCSHLPGLASYADMGDIAALIAPRPMLLITAARDTSFTVQGAKDVLAQARPAYEVLRAKGHLHLAEFDCGHDYNQPMREALYGFVLKHLCGRGDGSPHAEPPLALEPSDSPALRCFDSGRVPAEAATVRSLARGEALTLLSSLPAPGRVSREVLRQRLGWPEDPVSPAKSELVKTPVVADGPAKILLRTAQGVALPGLLVPGEPGAPTAIVLDEAGAGIAVGSPAVDRLRDAGWACLVIDLRGWGETQGREHLLATDSLLWGRALPTQRAQDLLDVVAHVRTAQGTADDTPALIVANGRSASLVALLAAAVGGEISAMALSDLPPSLLDLYDAGVPRDAAVWELLKTADLPHLRALAGCPIRSPFGNLDDLADWLRASAQLGQPRA